jgi:hypothetical protein
MKHSRQLMLTATALSVLSLALVPVGQEAAAHGAGDDTGKKRDIHIVSQSALLAGLPAQALFPFVDSTPSRIRRAHIAITDSTEDCTAGAAVPDNVQILVGVAGGTLVPVMTEATNTGISNLPGQCVFHVTVNAGAGDVPGKVTDIVVVNVGESPLTGINTITVSAEIVRLSGSGGHEH